MPPLANDRAIRMPVNDPGSMRLSPKQPCPVIQGMAARTDARAAPRDHRGRFGRNTNCPQSERPADVDHQPTYRRMQVHVLVRIGMVERQPGGGERRELCADFRGELPADARAEEVVHAESKLVRGKLSPCVDQIGNFRCRQHGGTVDRHQMQADAKGRTRPRPPHRIRGGWAGDHEARGIQNTVAVRSFDRLVDGFRKAEIIGGEDYAHFGPQSSECLLLSR